MTPTEASIKEYIQNLELLRQTMTKIGLSTEVVATLEASLQVAREYQNFLSLASPPKRTSKVSNIKIDYMDTENAEGTDD